MRSAACSARSRRVVFVLALAFDFELVQNLAPLALLGFVVQGVSVVHAWAHARHWPPGLVCRYVLLLVPALNVLAALPLSVVGVVDIGSICERGIRPQT